VHDARCRGTHGAMHVAGAAVDPRERGLLRHRRAGRAAGRSSKSGAGSGPCDCGLLRHRAKPVGRRGGGGAVGRVLVWARASIGSSAVGWSRSGGGEEEHVGR
jgi:hypothetical protein